MLHNAAWAREQQARRTLELRPDGGVGLFALGAALVYALRRTIRRVEKDAARR